MRRSEVNAILREAEGFIRERGFFLPPFAYWTPGAWAAKGPEAREVALRGLGWDVTDFGLGDYRRCGLLLFTLRNGDPAGLEPGRGKLYAEKLLVVGVDQLTPWHFHHRKTEDIINRGGGRLAVQLHASTADEALSDEPVTVSLDGVERTVEAGAVLTLEPGESVTLPPRLYHRFWGEGGRVLVGEVSTVNDDAADNRFLEPVGRFPDVEEDEPPLRLITLDYPGHYRHARSGGGG